MHDIRTRMTGLYRLLTGRTAGPRTRCAYPHPDLWGDRGMSEDCPAPDRVIAAVEV